MKKLVSGILLTAASSALFAQQPLPINVVNNFRVEYDDNIFTTGDGDPEGPQESWKLIEEIDILLDADQGNTYFGLRYIPSLVYYFDRPDDDTDLNHLLDFVLDHSFTPRTTLRLKDSFRVSEEPEVIDNDVTVRNNNDFIFNLAQGQIEHQLVPEKTFFRVDGKYEVIRYDDSDVAETSDYDQWGAGLDLVQQVTPVSEIGLQGRYYESNYDFNVRDLEGYQAGIVANHVFNPAFQADLRLGYESSDSDENEGTSDNPYGELSGVIVPNRDTRITLGIRGAQDRSPVNTFTHQLLTRVYGTWDQQLTAGMTLTLSGSYSNGQFDQDDTTSVFDPAVNQTGEETVLSLMGRLSYALGPRNFLDLTYKYNELESDVRPNEDFDRNRVSLGWRYTL